MGTDPRELSGLIKGKSCDDSYSHQHTASRHGLHELQHHLDSTDTNFLQTIGDNNREGTPASIFPSRSAVDGAEYCEITSDAVLNYICRMLLEEDIDEKVIMDREEAALRAVEKPFYDILGQKHPPSPDKLPPYSHQSSICKDKSSNSSHGKSNSIVSIGGLADNNWAHHFADNSDAIDFFYQPLLGSFDGVGNIVESFGEPLRSEYLLPNSQDESLPTLQFRKGVEEAKKFLPSIDKLIIDLEANILSFPRKPKKDIALVEVKAEEEEDKKEHLIDGSKCRKNPRDNDLDLFEGRSGKQSAVCSDDPIRNEMIDNVLLNIQGNKHVEDVIRLRELMENESSKNSQNGQIKGSNGGKKRGKKQTKVMAVDLRTLLIHCAQVVATDDRRTATELLKQIREHSLPNGDGCQRMAHWFACGLEARLAGTGAQIYQKLTAKGAAMPDMLKAFHLSITASPLIRVSHYFCNQNILNVAEKASKVHIVDFGIDFGFNWPCLIQRLSRRGGGLPKLRITGIDLPQPGFRPTKQVEETGRRLADYAREFQVPFEYQFIASKWETIRVEDINIDKDEVLIVSALFRLRNVIDETVAMGSPRDKVLNTIKQMNPSVFILGIVNGSYSSPFFVTRFREVLFHCTTMFDMLDTNVPRDNKQRLQIEKHIYGRDIVNVIACEGTERVERPETYKQWHVRILRAGFMQFPLNPAMIKIKDKVRAFYHKDFVVDEDSPWLLQGWKGRIVHALSAWKPSQI